MPREKKLSKEQEQFLVSHNPDTGSLVTKVNHPQQSGRHPLHAPVLVNRTARTVKAPRLGLVSGNHYSNG